MSWDRWRQGGRADCARIHETEPYALSAVLAGRSRPGRAGIAPARRTASRMYNRRGRRSPGGTGIGCDRASVRIPVRMV